MSNYSELESPWQVDTDRTRFAAPVVANYDYQRLIFNDVFRDGEVSANLVVRRTEKPEGEDRPDVKFDAKVGAIIFRFQNPDNYYYAGLGGYGNKFFIARMSEAGGKAIVTRGDSDSIDFEVPYSLAIRCSGNRISLLHNNVPVLEIFDSTYQSGQWGLQAWRTRVDFEEVKSSAAKPKCFVIMPFAAEFDSIFEVIRETVTSQKYECIRADERYLAGSITDDINEQIRQADLIVADLTNKNPNVYYEVGYAAALQKPVIQIAQSVENLPFDVRHLRTFSYTTQILGDRKLSADLINAMRALA